MTKFIDYAAHRAIYQGSDTNNYEVKDSPDTILATLKGQCGKLTEEGALEKCVLFVLGARG